ncbi:hypothetical protein Glove_341g3 [Diversispora epigaea]|uniref:Uncharacterized protein n=1 Tax=Diversispora epigaea TaxID=1348612 RepID=A0A397HH17_9GLOM|nr:hypothetical protein Glove_341g3 [Diversispora epigaea]
MKFDDNDLGDIDGFNNNVVGIEDCVNVVDNGIIDDDDNDGGGDVKERMRSNYGRSYGIKGKIDDLYSRIIDYAKGLEKYDDDESDDLFDPN